MRAGFMAERIAPRAAAAVSLGARVVGLCMSVGHQSALVACAACSSPPHSMCFPQALHFVEILVGPKCTELTVERPQQYHFDRERGCWAVLCLARVCL